MSTSPPLTPPECDLRDFPSMFLDVQRLLTSETWIGAAKVPYLSHALMSLWTAAWHQKPAASLPDSDAVLQRLSMLDGKAWAKVRDRALEGWIKCDDGRLYHPVVAEKALAAWTGKQAQRARTESARRAREEARQRQSAGPTDDVTASVTEAPQTQSQSLSQTLSQDPKGKGKGDSSSEPNGSGAASAAPRPTDADQRAWADAVELLTAAGRMTETKARTFFGGLLSRHRLVPKDLLAALAQAVANGTEDPQGYLTASAAGLAKRRSNSGTLFGTSSEPVPL